VLASPKAMEFRILGPLEVEENGRPLAPSGRKARALLAVLLIHANEPISADRLIDEVWGEELPENAAKSLQIQISRLRKILGSERLRTVGRTYELTVHEGELDGQRAEALLESGRQRLEQGQPKGAVSAFREALGLFRGRPLEEFADEPFARAEIARLEDLRLAAAEGAVDVVLAQGHGRRVVGELESLVAENPLRERPREQLMIALYQAGRQADALEVYADGRRTLDELGLEPGPVLRGLERRILTHDPALGAPGQGRMRARPGRQRAIAAAALMLVAAAIGIAARGEGNSREILPPRSLGALDATTLELRAIVPIGGIPSEIGVGRRAVFVGVPDRRSVVVVDPAGGGTSTIGAAVRPGRVAVTSRGIWLLDPRRRGVALLGSDRVYGIAEAAGRPGTAPLDAIAGARGYLWLAERDAELVFRLDPGTGRSSSVENRGPDSFFEGAARRGLAVGAGSVWVSNPVSDFGGSDRLGRVSRIDSRTGEVTARIRLPAPPVALAADASSVWVALERGQDVWRVDPRDEVAAAAVRVRGPVVDLAIGEGWVWALGADGTVSRIDPSTNAVTAVVQLDRGVAIAAGHGSVWVAAA